MPARTSLVRLDSVSETPEDPRDVFRRVGDCFLTNHWPQGCVDRLMDFRLHAAAVRERLVDKDFFLRVLRPPGGGAVEPRIPPEPAIVIDFEVVVAGHFSSGSFFG